MFATDAIAPSFSIDCISEKPSLLLPIQALFHLRSPSGRTSRFGATCGFSKDGPTLPYGRQPPKGLNPSLLVINSIAADFLATRVRSTRSNCPAFAIWSDDDATANRRFAVLLDIESQRTVIDLHQRPGIRVRIARYWVVLTVVLAGPLIVCWLAVATNTSGESSGSPSNACVVRRGLGWNLPLIEIRKISPEVSG